MKQEKINYSNLDIAKFVCALLVIAIHTDPLTDIAPEINFFLVKVLARVAVPLFFVTSGFLLTVSATFEKGRISKSGENRGRFLNYWKRIAILYSTWSLAYLLFIKIPMWHRIGWWGLHVVKDAVTSVLFSGIQYHLWYLLALLYAVPLFYCLLRVVKTDLLWILAMILWLGECLTYSYSSWVGAERIAALQWIRAHIPIALDAVFRALPLMLLGAAIAGNRKLQTGRKTGTLLCVSFLAFTVEIYMLRRFMPESQSLSYVFFTPALAVCLICFLIGKKQISKLPIPCPVLRGMSTVMYCLHPMIMEFLSVWEISAAVQWFVVTVLSVLISFVVVTRRYRFKRA